MFDKLCDELDVEFMRIGSITLANNEEEVEELNKLMERAKENTVKEFIDKKYYVKSDAQCSKPVDGEYHVYQLYEYDEVKGELKKVDIWVTIYE